MAVTLTVDAGAGGAIFTPKIYAAGDVTFLTGGITLPASYTANGVAMPLAPRFFRVLQGVLFEPRNGFAFEYDYGLETVQAYTNMHEYTPTVDPPSIAANTTVDVAVTVTGLVTTDHICAMPPIGIESGLVLLAARVTAANTLTLRLFNPTAGAIDGASRVWNVLAYSNESRQVAVGTNLSALSGIRFLAWGLV